MVDALKFYSRLGYITSNPKLYQQASKRERKLIQDLRLRRVEFILGAKLRNPNFIENFEVVMAQQLNFGPQTYIGPGTNLKLYVKTGELPKSKLDAAALKHDMAYVYASTLHEPKVRRLYVKAADQELLTKAKKIATSPTSTEEEVLNARLLQRLLGDIKGSIENYINLNFEGESEELTGQLAEKEFSKIVHDLQQLQRVSQLYTTLYNEALQLQQAHKLQHQPLNISHETSYSNFQEKFNLLKEDMSRRNQSMKILPDPNSAEQRSNPSPNPITTPTITPVVNQRLQDMRQQYSVLSKDVDFAEGAEAIIASNEAVARSQERINIEPQVITGERILRLYTYRDTGLSIIPNEDGKQRNRVFLAKFSRVAEGAGDLGNNLDTLAGQVTKPINNSLIRAWRHNQELRFAGRCFDGGAYLQPKKLPTEQLLMKHRSATIPVTPTQQQMLPANAVGYTRPGKKFAMMSNSNNRWVTPSQFRKENWLIFPQVVDGICT